jgi:probable phosphoglycerate mutase
LPLVELLLIRHAQPVRVEQAAGPADPPLTPLGHAQARAMSEWVSHEVFDALYVSPLVRARETAMPLAERTGLEPVIVEPLAEFDRHDPVYIPIEDLKAGATAEERERWKAMLSESDSAERRAWRDDLVVALETIINSHRGGRVAAICHGGVINAYLSHVLGMDNPLFFEPWYCSVNRVAAASSGERSLVTVNEAPLK